MIFRDEMLLREKKPCPAVDPERLLEVTLIAEHELERFGFVLNAVPPPEIKKILVFMARLSLSQQVEDYPPPERGLLIVGPPGRGKTLMASILSRIFQIQFYTMHELDAAWGRDPNDCESAFSTAFSIRETVIVDDLGAEAATKRYGNEPLARSLLLKMYENWKYFGKLVIITTNLSPKSAGTTAGVETIRGVFGERIESRFAEMFDVVRFTGTVDYRRIRNDNNNNNQNK